MRIYLIGFMGVGKTTVGKRLASRLKFAFLDMDQYIATHEKRSIEDLFESNGEESFRLLEKEYLRQTGVLDNTVIALGGGTPCFHDNISWINKHGVSVYLEANSKFLLSRLSQKKISRPLLKKIAQPLLGAEIERLLDLRKGFYEQSILKVEARDLSIDLIIRKIKDKLESIQS